MTAILFWAAVALVVYTYVGFPLLVPPARPASATAAPGRGHHAVGQRRDRRARRSGVDRAPASTTCSRSTTRRTSSRS